MWSVGTGPQPAIAQAASILLSLSLLRHNMSLCLTPSPLSDTHKESFRGEGGKKIKKTLSPTGFE